jgi:hypothetical protein
MKTNALPKVNQKHRLNYLAKNVKTVLFYIKLELINIERQAFFSPFNAPVGLFSAMPAASLSGIIFYLLTLVGYLEKMKASMCPSLHSNK